MSTPDPATIEWVPLSSGTILPDRLGVGTPLARCTEISHADQATETGWYEVQETGFTNGYSGTPQGMPAYAKWRIMAVRSENTEAGDTVRIAQFAFDLGRTTPNFYGREYSFGSWSSFSEMGLPSRLIAQTSLGSTLTNCNTATATNAVCGWYSVSNTTTNKPAAFGTGSGVLIMWAYNSTNSRQHIYETATGKVWERFNLAGSWSAWVRVGVIQGIGTALPTSAGDGEEFILTDSSANPTYQWKFRYIAAKTTNKWVFIGGNPAVVEVATSENHSTVGSYAALTTAQTFVIPLVGDYLIELGALMATGGAAGTGLRMSYDIGGTGAVDADALTVMVPFSGAGNGFHAFRRKRKLALPGGTLTVKYKTSSTNIYASDRSLGVLPIAIGG